MGSVVLWGIIAYLIGSIFAVIIYFEISEPITTYRDERKRNLFQCYLMEFNLILLSDATITRIERASLYDIMKARYLYPAHLFLAPSFMIVIHICNHIIRVLSWIPFSWISVYVLSKDERNSYFFRNYKYRKPEKYIQKEFKLEEPIYSKYSIDSEHLSNVINEIIEGWPTKEDVYHSLIYAGVPEFMIELSYQEYKNKLQNI